MIIPPPPTQGIPTLVNRYERNYEVILRDLKAKVPQVRGNIFCHVMLFFSPSELLNASAPLQEPLQMLILLAMAAKLQSYSEVCEALSTLEVALGFLAMTGGEPHMQLSTYLEEVLQMGSQTPPHILKVSSCQTPGRPVCSVSSMCWESESEYFYE